MFLLSVVCIYPNKVLDSSQLTSQQLLFRSNLGSVRVRWCFVFSFSVPALIRCMFSSPMRLILSKNIH